MDLRPGAVIAGRYRVDRKVGAGGMGEVWSGEHLMIGVRVALKTLLPAAQLNPEIVTRFKREAYLLGRIRSDYVARVLDFVADEVAGLVLVMEFIEGRPLGKLLAERVLDVEETIELGCDLASALCDLHRAHVVHRDLKPGNVILMPQHDGKFRAIVVDFGVSRMTSGAEDEQTMTGITRANMAIGTIEYMSPEQVLNSRDVTTSSDLYSVGAILYRAVKGQHVFGPTRLDPECARHKLHDEAPALGLSREDPLAAGLTKVVARLLRKKPRDRYAGADAMLKELGPLRDVARLSAIEFDQVTTEATQAIDSVVARKLMPAAHPAAALAANPTPMPGPTPAPALSPTPMPGSSPSAAAHAVAVQPAVAVRQGGASTAVVALGLLVALGAGAGGALVFAPRLGLTGLARPARPAATPPAPSAPPPPAPAPSAAPSAIETAEAEPSSVPEAAEAEEQPAAEPADDAEEAPRATPTGFRGRKPAKPAAPKAEPAAAPPGEEPPPKAAPSASAPAPAPSSTAK